MEEKNQTTNNNDESAAEERILQVKADEYQKIVEEAATYKDKFVRLFAEFDNARKRHERERADLIKYAHEEVVVELLGIVDDLDRSLDAMKKEAGAQDTLVKGVEMVANRMHALLKEYDVKPIESVGKMFDPHSHEVLMQIDSDDHPNGTVVEEFQKGYTLGGRVVRTAKVKVVKNNNNGK